MRSRKKKPAALEPFGLHKGSIRIMPRRKKSFFPLDLDLGNIGGSDDDKSSLIWYWKNDVWYSEDGVNWTKATENAAFTPRSDHSSFVYDNKMWVIGGKSGFYVVYSNLVNDIWYSEDGITWNQKMTSGCFAPCSGHAALIHEDKMWLIDAYRKIVWCSTGGTEWVQKCGRMKFIGYSGHESIVYDKKMWVIGGGPHVAPDGNYGVWYSTDGTVWNRTTDSPAFPYRTGGTSLVHQNKMWVIGGMRTESLNDVWHSEDGETWKEAARSTAFAKRTEHSSVVFHNKMWVIGGTADLSKPPFKDVWFSTDGAAWTLATDSPPFYGRMGHSSVVYDNKIWVIGGYNNNYFNDVWYSEDGINWLQATQQAAFSPRAHHTSLVCDGKMWIIGGYNSNENSEYYNDVWYSEDGANWTLATPQTPFNPRYDHSSVVFDDKIWVIAGHGQNVYDIWFSGMGPKPAVSNQSLDFGKQDIDAGPKGPTTATLFNLFPEGWDPLNILSAGIYNDITGAFSFSSGPDCRKLLVNDHRDFGIIFDPSEPVSCSADLVIECDDPSSPVITIRLTGEGVSIISPIKDVILGKSTDTTGLDMNNDGWINTADLLYLMLNTD